MPATAPVQRKAFALIVVAVLGNARRGLLRLAAGDEGRQAVDVVAAAVIAARLDLTRCMSLLLRWMLLRKRLRVARQERLRLTTHAEWSFGVDRGLLTVVLVVEDVVASTARRLAFDARQMRIVLAELLLRSGNQTVIMLGVLVVVLGGDRIAGGLGVARELNVFFGDMGGVAANFDLRAVRFVNTRHRIMIFAMTATATATATAATAAVTVVVIAAAHALVVLTVSHDLPVC